jgi:YNFM family putative membrane transporter
VINGLYVAFYYGGGTIGSYLPGYVYRDFGWNGFILLLCAVILVALALAVHLSRLPLLSPTRDDASA